MQFLIGFVADTTFSTITAQVTRTAMPSVGDVTQTVVCSSASMLRKHEATIVPNNWAHYLFPASFVSQGSCTNSCCLRLFLWRCKALPANILPSATMPSTEEGSGTGCTPREAE